MTADALTRRLGYLVRPSVPGRCARAAGTYDWAFGSGTTVERPYPCDAYRELSCVETCPFEAPADEEKSAR